MQATHPINAWLDEGRRSSDTIPLAIAELQKRGCDSIYDAGCGNGDLLKSMIEFGSDYAWGSDIEPGHIAIAHEKISQALDYTFMAPSIAAVWVADACTFRPCADGHLDAVTALNWLQNFWPSEHATGIEKLPFNPNYLRQALRTFRDLLRPGGIFIWDHPQPDQCARGLSTLMRNLVLERFASIEERRDGDLAICIARKA